MHIWIDVEDASGNRYGDGPITTATQWRSIRRLDAAGGWSFRMPAGDPRAALLRNKRVVRCWSADYTGVVERGAGIIDTIEIEPSVDGPTMLSVSGDDLLRELVYRDVGVLNLYDDVQAEATLSLVGLVVTLPITLPATINLDTANYLTIGYAETFSRVDITLTSPVNNQPAQLIVQYWNASGDWEDLSLLADTTIVAGKPLAQSGYLSFAIPAGWAAVGGLYRIRLRSDRIDLDPFRATAINVHRVLSTADALQTVMAAAPDGWTLDGAGAFATEDDVYLPVAGGSVLATLGKLAQQTGEHFRLAVSGRRVHWLGSTLTDSGLRAVAATELSPGTMLIASLREWRDSYDLYTRIYCYGAGEGDNRLTLAATTRSAPTGYVLSASGSYIERSAGVAEYGRIDRVETFSDIVPVDISTTAQVNAANTLFDRGLQRLMRQSQLQYAYDLTVIPSREPIYPGQTVRVQYDEWVDGYHAVQIDDDLVVLETQQEIGENGIMVSALVVATVDAWPASDADVIAHALAMTDQAHAVRMPEAYVNSDAMGVPVYLGIQSGRVVAINRVTPVADGTYSPITRLSIERGLITAVNP